MRNAKTLAALLPRLVSRREFHHNPVNALIKRIACHVRWIDSSGERIGQSSHSTDVGSGKWERRPSLFLELAWRRL
jgi:hypothetical protein